MSDQSKIYQVQNKRAKDQTDLILKSDGQYDAVRWYHWCLYDTRYRILYSTIFAIFIGLGLPLILYSIFKHPKTAHIGSCLISPSFRFECQLNTVVEVSENDCRKHLCCFDSEITDRINSQNSKCHHSFGSAYSYSIQNIIQSDVVDITLAPKFDIGLKPLPVRLEWIAPNHFSIQFNSGPDSDQRSSRKVKNNETGDFDVNFAKQNEFFIRIERRQTKQSIFDTRLGPIISDKNSLIFTTLLATSIFTGLKGGLGDNQLPYAVVNAPGSLELPFYLASDSNGQFHGVLIETKVPFMVQVIRAPGIMFHFEGVNPHVKLHFFSGPTPAQVYAQLYKQIGKFTLPSMTMLGVHLCRKNYTLAQTHKELLTLEGIEGNGQPIPYDTDCLDYHLRSPFRVDNKNYPKDSDSFRNVLQHLKDYNRQVLLTQKMELNPSTYSSIAKFPLILDSTGKPLTGKNGIVFPDYINPYSQSWATDQLELTKSDFSVNANMIVGLNLVDNFPLQESTNTTIIASCENEVCRSKLRDMFHKFHLIKPNAQHITRNSSDTQFFLEHFEIHNTYGQAASAVLRNAFHNSGIPNKSQRHLIISASPWIGESGAFSGLNVPFTWEGLTDGLAHLLRHFMLLPFGGIPICGSHVARNLTTGIRLLPENWEELCLRWFQLGLMLPFSSNTQELNGVPGPLNFSLVNQRFLIGAIRRRYSLIPYFYTQLYLETLSPAPLIRPLLFDFASAPDYKFIFEILTQFTIGPTLMVAPILSHVTSRDVYFPANTTWYDMEGNLIIAKNSVNRTLAVPSILSEIPVFIRSGHVIPIIIDASAKSRNLWEIRQIGKYRILATFPEESDTSTGDLYLDDGRSTDSISNVNFDLVKFKLNKSRMIIETNCGFQEQNYRISKIISEIRIFGFPNPEAVTKLIVVPMLPNWKSNWKTGGENGGKFLQIFNLDFMWCSHNTLTLTWEIKTK